MDILDPIRTATLDKRYIHHQVRSTTTTTTLLCLCVLGYRPEERGETRDVFLVTCLSIVD